MNGSTGPRDREIITSLSQPLKDAGVGYISAMAECEVMLAPPSGYVIAERGCNWARIGFVVLFDDGLVVAVHCIDATAPQISAVMDQAELARVDGAIGPQWSRIRDGFECSVLEPIGDALPPTARCSRAARP